MRYRLLPLTLVALATVSLTLHAQPTTSAVGDWKGAIEIPGSPLEVTVHLTGTSDALAGTIDIPAQGASALPLASLWQRGDSVGFSIKGIPGNPTFAGRLQRDGAELAGGFTQGPLKAPFTLARQSEETLRSEAASTDSLLQEIVRTLRSGMDAFDVPGAAIAIVRGDSVLLSTGLGYRSLAARDTVTSSTLFAIGSSTKAFTATLVGTLADEGQISWDEPVRSYLPDFRLYDDYATERMTPVDLLTHVSGLPRHDLLWYGSPLSRQELIERLRYLEPTAQLRERWQYQNLMFLTAGYLAEKVTGKSWEELVRDRIFAPLGMTASGFSLPGPTDSLRYALPYYREGTETKVMPYRNIAAIGPAGSIMSNADDMARWAMMNIGGGEVDGKRVVSEGTLSQIHEPLVVVSGGGKEKLFTLYGMGWFVSAYRGHRLVQHGGNIDGFSALVALLPDDDIGLVILTNMNGSPFPEVAMRAVLDRFIDAPEKDWFTAAAGQMANMEEMEQEAKGEVERVPNTRPSHRLVDYVGEYTHPAYGRIVVTEERDRLRVRFNEFGGELEHFHYDVFSIAKAPEPYNDLRLQFRTALDGSVDAVLAQLEPALDPMVFERLAPEWMRSAAGLARYEGKYEVSGMTVQMEVVGNQLIMHVPGQPDYTLVPQREDRFTVRDLAGYALSFQTEKGKVVSATLMQPNGTFKAKRVEE